MLKGEKIILRPLKIEDLEKTHKWRNDFELTKLTQGIRFPKTLEMDREWFDNVLNDKSNRNIYFGIDEIEKNEFIGIIQLNNIDWISSNCDFGISIGSNGKRGRGYGMQAMSLLFDYAFFYLNLRKILLKVVKLNIGAIKLYQKMGFTQEGFFIEQYYCNNEYHDVIIMSLFKKKWLEIGNNNKN